MNAAAVQLVLWKGDVLIGDQTLAVGLDSPNQYVARLNPVDPVAMDYPRSIWNVSLIGGEPNPPGSHLEHWLPMRVALVVNGTYLSDFVPIELFTRPWHIYLTWPLRSRWAELPGIYTLGARVQVSTESDRS